MNLKNNLPHIIPTVLFCLGLFILCIPIFSMDYILSLDGPTHFYNGNLFNQLVFEHNKFIDQYFCFNSEPTPNYIGLIWSALLLKVFPTTIAIKAFYLSYIAGLLFSLHYFIRGFIEVKKLPLNLTLLLPFIFSFFFISGFFNFQLAFIPLFLTAGFYVRQQKINLKTFILLTFGILITYFSHSIVFGFLIIFLGSLEFTKTVLINRDIKALFKKALLITLLSIIPISLTLMFMGNRESTPEYLDFWELVNNLFRAKSLSMFKSQGTLSGYLFSTLVIILAIELVISSARSKNRIRPKDSLLLAAVLFLTCYFILPDSVGFASVFSVRIEYMLWTSIVIWIILTLKNAYLSLSASLLMIAIIAWNTTIIKSELSELNSIGKKVIAAADFIEPNSTVYPIFASPIWNHFHFSNLLGLEKPMLILENSTARQDYFPIQYKEAYENCLKSESFRSYSCDSKTVKIDYLLLLGNEVITVDIHNQILNSLTDQDTLIYENHFIKLYKLNP